MRNRYNQNKKKLHGEKNSSWSWFVIVDVLVMACGVTNNSKV